MNWQVQSALVDWGKTVSGMKKNDIRSKVIKQPFCWCGCLVTLVIEQLVHISFFQMEKVTIQLVIQNKQTGIELGKNPMKDLSLRDSDLCYFYPVI